MNSTRDNKPLFSEALKELVELLKQKRLADVFRFIPFAAGESYGPHSHLRIELNYVKKGSCRILLEEETVSFQEGDLMLIPSHVSHKFEAGKKGCTLMQLEFLPDIFWQVNSLQPLSAGQEDTSFASPLRSLSEQKRLLKIEDDLRIVQEIRSIINELQQQEEGYEYLVVLSYVELMVLIYRYASRRTFPTGMNSFLIAQGFSGLGINTFGMATLATSHRQFTLRMSRQSNSCATLTFGMGSSSKCITSFTFGMRRHTSCSSVITLGMTVIITTGGYRIVI